MPTTSTITVAGSPVALVALPTCPAPRAIDLTFNDAVGMTTSVFTGQQQTQSWPGADWLGATVTLPPITLLQRAPWFAFLMAMRGMQNAVQLGDPLYVSPSGQAAGAPVADCITNPNNAMSQQLYTRGWVANVARQLLAGDMLQIGYRLHYVLDTVNSDASGNAVIPVWPSLREQPADGEAIVLRNPQGLFRFAKNDRAISTDVGQLTQLSLQLREYR
jgi:hypothetical protein